MVSFDVNHPFVFRTIFPASPPDANALLFVRLVYAGSIRTASTGRW